MPGVFCIALKSKRSSLQGLGRRRKTYSLNLPAIIGRHIDVGGSQSGEVQKGVGGGGLIFFSGGRQREELFETLDDEV